jgi:hypothetical protein
VATGLHPDAQAPVSVQDDTTGRDDECGRRHVMVLFGLREWISRPGEAIERHRDRRGFTLVNRLNAFDLRPQCVDH